MYAEQCDRNRARAEQYTTNLTSAYLEPRKFRVYQWYALGVAVTKKITPNYFIVLFSVSPKLHTIYFLLRWPLL